MKFLRQGICLLALGGGVVAVPGLAAQAAPAPAEKPSLTQKMKDEAEGSVTFTREKATGKVGFVRAAAGGDLLPDHSGNARAKSRAYLDEFAPAFGARSAELLESEVTTSQTGTTVTYVQEFRGVPVFGAMVRTHLDKQGDLVSVNGAGVPGLDLSVTPRVGAVSAGKRAVTMVKTSKPTDEHGHHDVTGVQAEKPQLIVYRKGFIKGEAGKSELAWQVEVTNKRNVRDIVIVSAESGKMLNRWSLLHDALDREFYEIAPTEDKLVWKEGDALPGTLNADQESMVRSTGDAYWFFKNAFGRDSYDGNGATMKTVNNDPDIDCPNANWNGITTNYCDGVSSDDVVAHEWGHAYTEYTNGLIYQWQAGALNEAYSDIWGETVDLINGRLDGDEGELAEKRPVGQCSTHSPAKPVLVVSAPADIARECRTGGAAFGPALSGSGVSGSVVMALDADENAGTAGDQPTNPFDTGGSAYDACSPLTNAEALAGKVVMVNRGLCGFEVKARNVDAAGAIGVIIGNRNEGEVFAMSGDADPDPEIPAVMIDKLDRNAIAGKLEAGTAVSVTMKDAGGDRGDSYRWLMGEDSSAFGGAIRDMWNPTCYGDPGKVSDVEYVCNADDHGGVHSNSGVPNHGYALLVDGGTFNGHTVEGIGLDKAAAIYWKVQSEYQTPISDFVDHADSLEAACAELTGKAIKKLSTAPNDAQVAFEKVTSADCAQVHAMTEAIELRLDPTEKCAWTPTLDPDAPAVCGDDFTADAFWSEDFEDGLTGWTLSGENPHNGPLADWEASSQAPAGHASKVAYGPAPEKGQCDGSTADFSSVNFLTSGDIVIEGDAAPRMTFDHYIATEAGVDAGLVEISRNGGAFEAIPTAAYTFNGPSAVLTGAQGNTNPYAGKDGFSGTNPGAPFGSWGESQVDLAQAGVGVGDTIKLRFAIGRDGCGGVDGWYVDDIELVSCVAKAEAAITAVHQPVTAAYGSAHSVKVTVAGKGDATAPTGTVTIKEGATTLGSGTLAGGVATVSLPTTMAVGAHALTVEYGGDDVYKSGTASTSADVTKALSTTTAAPKPATVAKGATFVVKAKVTAAGTTPTGKVKIYKGTTLLGKGTLEGGVVKIQLGTSKLVLGTNKLKAVYVGSPTVAGSKATFSVTVVK